MSNMQIAKELDDNPVNTSKKIKIILRHKEIKCVELNRHKAAKLLDWKIPIRRTRFYYISVDVKIIKKWRR